VEDRAHAVLAIYGAMKAVIRIETRRQEETTMAGKFEVYKDLEGNDRFFGRALTCPWAVRARASSRPVTTPPACPPDGLAGGVRFHCLRAVCRRISIFVLTRV
jgi:hypothetical protein